MNFFLRISLIMLVFASSLELNCQNLAGVSKNTPYVDSQIEVAKKIIDFLRGDQLDSIKAITPEVVKLNTPDSIWLDIISRGRLLLSSSRMPTDSLIQVSTKSDYNILTGQRKIYVKMSFPFIDSTQEVSPKYINIATERGQIYTLGVGDYPFGWRIVAPKHKEPHLTRHSIDFDSVSWFRIWYSDGFMENEYGDEYGYYAVSGEKEKLYKMRVETDMIEVFDLINSAIADSIDFNHIEEKNSKPEYLYLRFRLENEPYKKFGEFSVYCVLEEEPGMPEELSRYIRVKHSKTTRYLYLKSENLELFEKLKEIAYRDYEEFMEMRLH